MTELTDEEREAFEILAGADLPVSKWAEKLLEIEND